MGDTIRLAVCGFGLIGMRHTHAIAQADGVSLAKVVEPDHARRIKAREDGFVVCAQLDEALSGGDLDGVILSTPTPLHAEQAQMCIQAGCPVLVEKPIAVTLDEARALTRASEDSGVPVLVGHHRRHNPLIARAKEALAAGRIGDIRAITASCWFYKPDSYFDTAPWRKKAGAGPLSVNLVHDIDLIRHFCGEVLDVVARTTRSVRGHENEDLAAAILTMTSGALATITVSDSIAAPWSWEMTSRENPVYPATSESCYHIGGSRGALSIPDLHIWSHDGGAPDWWTPIAATTLTTTAADPLVVQIEHFRDVIRNAVEPLVSAREGMRTLQVVDAIAASAASGLPVSIPPG